MTKTDKKRVAQNLETLAACLDAQWCGMHHPQLSKASRKASEGAYCGMLQTLITLGGDFMRDAAGNHRVFLAGLSSRAADDYKEE